MHITWQFPKTCVTDLHPFSGGMRQGMKQCKTRHETRYETRKRECANLGCFIPPVFGHSHLCLQMFRMLTYFDIF